MWKTQDYKYFERSLSRTFPQERENSLRLNLLKNSLIRLLSRTSKRLPEIHHQQFWLGHFLDRVAQALAAEAGVLHAAIGHLVDAE